MFCPRCGAEIEDGSRFCTRCGANVAEMVAQRTADGARMQQSSTPQQISQAQQPPQPTPVAAAAPKNRKVAIIAIAACVVAACAGVFIWLALSGEFNRPDADGKFVVPVTINADGYNAETDSPFPVHIEGTDADGNSVNEDDYIASDGAGLNLKPGTYTLTVTTVPLLANGTFYAAPEGEYPINVGEHGVSKDMQITLDYTTSDISKVSEEQVDTAYSAAVASGFDLASASTDKSELSDAAAAARKEAYLATAWHYECAYAAVDLPGSWKGRVVDPSPEGHASGYYHVDFFYNNDKYDYEVIRLDGMEGEGAPDLGYSNPGGLIWDHAHGNYSKYDTEDSVLADALDMLGNGQLTTSQVAACASRDEAEKLCSTTFDAFLDEYVRPTVTGK